MDNKQNQNLIVKMICIFFSVLKKWQIIMIIVFISAVGLDVYKTLTFQPLYENSMKVVLNQGDNTYSQLEEALSYAKTLDYIFNGQVAKDYIMEKLDVDELNMNCSITSQDNTNIVVIKVLAPTKKESYYSLKYLVEWYQNHMDQYHFTYSLNILEKTPISENTINQNSHLKNLKQGFLISFILVIFLLSLYEYFKDTIKVADDIQRKLDSRLFAKIPKERKSKVFWKKNRSAILVTSLKTSFYYRESINKLRNRFEESAKKHHYQSLMITSSLENEGKSSIAANLALALAKNNHKVLLIDGDLRKPSVNKIFDVKDNRSLNSYLNGANTWQSQVIMLPKTKLCLLCAKQNLIESEMMLSSEKMRLLLEEAKKEFDYIIVDSSPAYDLNDPLIINENVDASLLVVKQDEATTRLINETISSLVDVKNNLIGCIYNARVIDLGKQHRVYGYHYGYSRYRKTEGRG